MHIGDEVAQAAVERGTMPIARQIDLVRAMQDRSVRVVDLDDAGLTREERDALLFQWWQMRRAGGDDVC